MELIAVSGVIASTPHVLQIPENANVLQEEWDRDVMKVSSASSIFLLIFSKNLTNLC